MRGRSASSREREGRVSAFGLRTVPSSLGAVASPRPDPSNSPLARAPDAAAEVRGFAFASYACRAGRRRGRRDGGDCTSVDRVHRTYLDCGAKEQPRRAPARRSLENSCSMSLAPSRPDSTPVCSATTGEQQIQFGTHLLLVRVGNAAEADVLAAARTRTEVPRARETTAAEARHVHQ